MERQSGKRTRRDDEDALAVLDQAVHRSKQGSVKLMREVESEQIGRIAGLHRVLRAIDIEAAPECRDLLLDRITSERDRMPIGLVACDREDVALIFSSRCENNQRLIAGQQRLNVLHSERCGMR